MKVLLAAAACEPGRGSELDVGWRAATLIGSVHETWVLCSHGSREAIEAAQREGNVPGGLHFVYCGGPVHWHPNRMLARIQSWGVYRDWLAEVERRARELHAGHRFDVTHHVTYSTVRMASPLWRLPVPHVWGPVGGVGEYPMRFLPMLSRGGACFEIARTLSNRSLHVSPSIRGCARRSRILVASNDETRRVLEHWRGSGEGIETLSAASFPAAKVAALRAAGADRSSEGPLQLFAGGNLIGSKGVAFALEALAEVRRRGVPFRYRVRGGGPEMAHLQHLIASLGLGDSVETGEALCWPDYSAALGTSHLYLLPSFRENAPLTLLEAMLAGSVPVVVASSAQGEIVRASGAGAAVDIQGGSREVVLRLADAICGFDADRTRLAADSQTVAAFVADRYSEAHYRREILRIYDKAAGAEG